MKKNDQLLPFNYEACQSVHVCRAPFPSYYIVSNPESLLADMLRDGTVPEGRAEAALSTEAARRPGHCVGYFCGTLSCHVLLEDEYGHAVSGR